MYCYLKFAGEEEQSDYKIDEIKDRSGLDKSESKYSKISLISPKNKNRVLLLNPDCYIQILIDYIYEETKLERNVLFDLCDESGALLGIASLKPYESALELMKHKELYYIILYQRDDNGSFTKLEPYLHKSNKQEVDFFMKFGRSSISKKHTGGLKKSSSRLIRSASKQSSKRRSSTGSYKSKASNIST